MIHPALFYGCSTLLGCYIAFDPQPILLFPAFCLWFPFLYLRRYLTSCLLSGLLFFSAWLYTVSMYDFPQLPEEGLQGTAYFQIESFSQQKSPFGYQWVYRGTVHHFLPHYPSHVFPCILTLPTHHAPPLANKDYWIASHLVQTPQGYRLKPLKHLEWQTVATSWSWASSRYQWKQKVTQWIQNQCVHPKSGIFLAGLITGDFHDLEMRAQFAQFGLQHLLAISGFHFALVAGFLNFILRLVCRQQVRLVVLLLLLSAYCFFLGPQPSILRAWLMSIFAIGGEWIHKQSRSLNMLGIALLCLLSWNPLCCLNVGFQLSFAVTFAILLFLKPAQQFFQAILMKRGLSQVIQMNRWNQVAYIFLSFLRQGLTLTVAVNIFAFPLTLFFFSFFPWMSLLYNLFFPFLASLSLTFFLFGVLLNPVPGLATLIHYFNDFYTFYILKLTQAIIPHEQHYLVLSHVSEYYLLNYLCLTGLLGIHWNQSNGPQFLIEPLNEAKNGFS